MRWRKASSPPAARTAHCPSTVLRTVPSPSLRDGEDLFVARKYRQRSLSVYRNCFRELFGQCVCIFREVPFHLGNKLRLLDFLLTYSYFTRRHVIHGRRQIWEISPSFQTADPDCSAVSGVTLPNSQSELIRSSVAIVCNIPLGSKISAVIDADGPVRQRRANRPVPQLTVTGSV